MARQRRACTLLLTVAWAVASAASPMVPVVPPAAAPQLHAHDDEPDVHLHEPDAVAEADETSGSETERPVRIRRMQVLGFGNRFGGVSTDETLTPEAPPLFRNISDAQKCVNACPELLEMRNYLNPKTQVVPGSGERPDYRDLCVKLVRVVDCAERQRATASCSALFAHIEAKMQAGALPDDNTSGDTTVTIETQLSGTTVEDLCRNLGADNLNGALRRWASSVFFATTASVVAFAVTGIGVL